ncbi:hypothetical protein Thal_0738 [Thermocrinis albus DSM 14484]|uniref:Uncharacterized protein n=1 Tax=Thermocrinis albus (strain DSM 14484 / JCM 11386 / HI 11/12) TaxID=638303 RepID=D3SQD4_THEAH|nr:hypothetical protein [Thermocrinis albus]ADC89371.1 hypothetical protein Thal_0738 [Thermocrinis albus DSM 14484]
MLSRRLFEGTTVRGIPGLYPLTMENLMRLGLALCALLRIEELEPVLVLEDLNFLTMSVAVGFMGGGGDVKVGEGEGRLFLRHRKEGEEDILIFEGLKEEDTRKLEMILFGRYNIPRKEGKEIGRLWIRGRML